MSDRGKVYVIDDDEAMRDSLDFLLGLITFAIAVLPLLLFIVLPIYLVLRYFWRKSRRRKTAGEIFKDEVKEEL